MWLVSSHFPYEESQAQERSGSVCRVPQLGRGRCQVCLIPGLHLCSSLKSRRLAPVELKVIWASHSFFPSLVNFSIGVCPLCLERA